jgi:hypothetical protein
VFASRKNARLERLRQVHAQLGLEALVDQHAGRVEVADVDDHRALGLMSSSLI